MDEGYVGVEYDFIAALPHIHHTLGVVLGDVVPLHRAEELVADALRSNPQAGRMSERQRQLVWEICDEILQTYCKPE